MGEVVTGRRGCVAAGTVAGRERETCRTTFISVRDRSFRSSRTCGRAVRDRRALSAARSPLAGNRNHAGQAGLVTSCRRDSGARSWPAVREHADAEFARPVPEVPDDSTDSAASRLASSLAMPVHCSRRDQRIPLPRATAGSGPVVPRGRNGPGSRSCECGRTRAGARAA